MKDSFRLIYFAKGSVRKSYSYEVFFLLSIKHNTFPFRINTVTKKTHSNQECSLLVYDCETIFEGVPRLLLYLICFLRFMISQPQRGVDRGSHVIGKSVHSQGVERLKHNVGYAITYISIYKIYIQFTVNHTNTSIFNIQGAVRLLLIIC